MGASRGRKPGGDTWGRAGTRWLGQTVAPARFLAFFAVSGLSAGALGATTEPLMAWILGFDVGAATFLVSLLPLTYGARGDEIRRHARDNDANRVLVLLVTILVASVVLSALALASLDAPNGIAARTATMVTLLLCWLFVNAVFTLHYAHLFYSESHAGGDSGGLEFPRCPAPDYLDFAYFALTVGMTFQTSDVQVTCSRVRRVVTLHALASFVFDLGVVAFAINVIGASSS